MLGKLNSAEIEEVLCSQVVGRVGCHANGVTYIVPTSYAYDGKHIYAYCKGGMKLEMMRQNPAVCFEVECFSDMANWQTVITWGRFEEVTDAEERAAALHKLLRRNLPVLASETVRLSPNWPFMPNDLNTIEGILYRIDIKEKTGRFENTEGAHEVHKTYL